MAITSITATKLDQNLGSAINPVAIGADGAKLPFGDADNKILVLLTAGSSAGTITVEKGTGIQGIEDITVSVPANKTVAINLESGKFKKMDGANKGCVVITGTSSVTVSVVVLP